MHILACSWSFVGMNINGSWIDGGKDDGSKSSLHPIFMRSDKKGIYIAAIYWVITTLTTVGYGDYTGYTEEEYLFEMAVEFIGIGFFSFFMGSINSILVLESKLQDIIEEKMEDLDIWLRKLDKSRSSR